MEFPNCRPSGSCSVVADFRHVTSQSPSAKCSSRGRPSSVCQTTVRLPKLRPSKARVSHAPNESHPVPHKPNDDPTVAIKPSAKDLASKSRGGDDGSGDMVTVNLDYLSPIMFLEISNTKFGPTSAFEGFEFRSISHDNGFLEAREDGTMELMFEAKEDRPVDLTATMEFYRKDYKELCERSLLRSVQNNRIRFAICFPDNGIFVVRIFAAELLTSGGVAMETTGATSCHTNIINYLVVVSNRSHSNFPRVFPHWNSTGCVLIEPLYDCLPSHSSVKFVLRVTGAKQVTVLSEGDETTELEKDLGEFWKGSVVTGSFDTQLNVYARFGETSDLVGPFLRYKIVKSHIDYTYDNMVKLEMEILRLENEKLVKLRRKILAKLTSIEHLSTADQLEKEEQRIREWSKKEKKRLYRLGKNLKQHQLRERRKAEVKKLSDVDQSEKRRLATLLQATNVERAEVMTRNDVVIDELEQELRERLAKIAEDLEDIVSETGWTEKQLSRRREAQRTLLEELHTLHCQTVADVRRKSARHLSNISRIHEDEVENFSVVQSKIFSTLQQCLEKLFPSAVVNPSTVSTGNTVQGQRTLLKDTQGSAKGRLVHAKIVASKTEKKLRQLKVEENPFDANDNETC